VKLALAATALALAAAGCGGSAPARPQQGGGNIPASLLAGLRPDGRGPRFQPPVRGHPTGTCTAKRGARDEAHVELFAANRVVLIAAGVGTEPPRQQQDGRVTKARCYGNAVTLDPTGVVYFRPGATLQDLFKAWRQPLTPTQLASFRGTVRAYVDGKRQPLPKTLQQHEQIVLEVGPYVPPHKSYPPFDQS
jgi:hypothetical protein